MRCDRCGREGAKPRTRLDLDIALCDGCFDEDDGDLYCCGSVMSRRTRYDRSGPYEGEIDVFHCESCGRSHEYLVDAW